MASSEETIQAIEREISCVVNSINKLTGFQAKLEENRTCVKSEVRKAFEVVISTAMQRETELIQEFETSLCTQQAQIQTLLASFHQKLGSLETLLQLAKEGKHIADSSLYQSDNYLQTEGPVFKFQSTSLENLQEAILSFGCIDAELNVETSLDKSDISKWLQNVNITSEHHSVSSDFVLLGKGTVSSPSVISIMESDPICGLDVTTESIKCPDSVCKGDETCCECIKEESNVDVESLFNVWLKKNQGCDMPDRLPLKQALPLTVPKTSEVCIANEKCKFFDECLCDENCAVRALKQQLEMLDVQANHNHLLDTVNETIKESLLKDEKNRDKNMWLQSSTKNNKESKENAEKNAKSMKPCKRKPDDDLTNTWLSKSQRLGSSTGNEHCTKVHNFTIPECQWLKKETKCTPLRSMQITQSHPTSTVSNELAMWLLHSKKVRYGFSAPLSTQYWLTQSHDFSDPVQKKAQISVFPQQALFFATDVNMWLKVKSMC